ncbi:hypothetical protein [Burkholderia sp. BCC1977]|uniref:hypothetical protein n=1 Tax=Burkholderia sp. BCC1977 TaxID=2817440 RepID=UPI002ABDF22E|nr:hypothetical protein [Burkholderia sp. BCC1977]
MFLYFYRFRHSFLLHACRSAVEPITISPTDRDPSNHSHCKSFQIVISPSAEGRGHRTTDSNAGTGSNMNFKAAVGNARDRRRGSRIPCTVGTSLATTSDGPHPRGYQLP